MAITRSVFGSAISDAERYVKGKTITAAATTETVAVVSVPKKAFVTDIWIDKIVAFATSGTFTVGFTGNGESEDVDYFGADAQVNSDATGVVRLTTSKYFEAASGLVTVTTTGGGDANDGTAKYRVFVEYVVLY
jgi:hypothetical protein